MSYVNPQPVQTVEPRSYRSRPVRAVQVTPSNTYAIADWCNGEPGAFHRGYAGRAYPDFCGVELPGDDADCNFAPWGDWVILTSDGRFLSIKQHEFLTEYVETDGAS